jgi:hypothetical protein
MAAAVIEKIAASGLIAGGSTVAEGPPLHSTVDPTDMGKAYSLRLQKEGLAIGANTVAAGPPLIPNPTATQAASSTTASALAPKP